MSELYLKNQKVLTLKDEKGVPKAIQKIDCPELLPLCLKASCTDETFAKWLEKRGIPENREGLKEAIEEFGDAWTVHKNYASLSDQYWIKWREETWKKVNFFTNRYSPDIGDMMFAPWSMGKRKINPNSPDLSTNGVLKKRWIQNSDLSSSLVKAGSVKAHQEPLSEVLVSTLCERIGKIQSANYNLHIEGTQMCSICPNFITENTELVPASFFYFDKPREANETIYHHLLKACEDNDIPDAENYINYTILIDNLTGNEDRHLNNIAFIRDVNTLKFIGPAPLFDCGNAYWSSGQINQAVKSKTFGDVEKNIVKQMKAQCDLSFLQTDKDYERVIGIYPEITDTKKENLIEAIKKRNNQILQEKRIEDFER